MSASPVLSSLVLGLLLGATILAAAPAAAITPDQSALVAAAYGPGAPFMQWMARPSTQTFYLHSDPTGDGTVPFSMPDAITNAKVDANEPTTEADPPITFLDGLDGGDYGNQVLLGCSTYGNAGCFVDVGINSVQFPMSDELAPEETIKVFGFSSRIWAACQKNTAASNIGFLDPNASGFFYIYARLLRQVKDETGNWVNDPTVGTAGNSNSGVIAQALLEATGEPLLIGATTGLVTVEQFVGSTTVGNIAADTGPTLSPGQRFVVQYELEDESQDIFCNMYYDATHYNERSRVTLTTNAHRMAAFPANLQGGYQAGFPSAATTGHTGRRFAIEALQATAWGPQPALLQQMQGLHNDDDQHANVRLYDEVNQKYLYFVDDRASNGGNFPRDNDIQEIKLDSSRADQPVPEPDIETPLVVNGVQEGILRRSYVFQYPETLPDTRIVPTFYSFSDSWEVTAPTISLGGRGFTFELFGDDDALHEVNPREPTEFLLLLRNTGTALDSISVAVADPGDGWTARVLGGGIFTLPPNAAALVSVEVVPAPTAVNGNSKAVTVSASSAFSDVSDPEPITLTTRVTNTVRPGVELVVLTDSFQVAPGQTKDFAVTLRNLGTRRDSFTVIPSFPATVQGWTITARPSSVQVVAGGLQQIQVSLHAPAEAPTGMTFPLGITAVAVGNAATNSRVDVPVEVISSVGLVLGVLDQGVERRIREDAPDQCVNGANVPVVCGTAAGTPVPDTDFDRSAIFRIPFTNDGNVAEQFRVEAVWDKTVKDTRDVNGCDGDPVTSSGSAAPDGIPDGWRYRWMADLGAPMPAERQWDGIGRQDDASGGFAGRYQLQGLDNLLTIPPKTTVMTYLEIGNVGEYDCQIAVGVIVTDPRGPFDVNAVNSPAAGMLVTATSIRDPARSATVPAVVRIDAAGEFIRSNEWTGSTHNVGIDSNGTTSKPVSEGDPAVFDVIVTNKANDVDGLKVSVAGDSDWTHQVLGVRRVPDGLPCGLPGPDGAITCPGLGVYDEVHLQVVATPGPNVEVGDADPITVTVQSVEVPGISRTLNLQARAAGTHDFDLVQRGASTRTVTPGQAVSFPFVVRNVGTADDSYRITWTTGSPAWLPSLDTTAPIFVPAGSEVPTLFTVVAPATSAAGATDTFRVRVESVLGGMVKTFEATPVAQPPSGLQVFGKDGQDVLIPTRNTDTSVTIRTVQVSGNPATQATLTVDAASLPPRWTVDRTSATVSLAPNADGQPAGEAVFKVRAPSDALGSSHGLLRVEAKTAGASPLVAFTDVRLNLASTFGVDLNVTDVNGTRMVIAPGGPAVFNLTVHNRGLGTDVVRLTHTQLPAGWSLLFSATNVELGPLQKRTVEAKVTAPVAAKPADIASFVVFASSEGSPTEIDSVALQAQVGFNAVQVERVGTAVPKGAPQETLVWVLNVTNNGTLPDEVRLSGAIDTSAVRSLVNATIEPSRVLLDPNQTVQVRVAATLGEAVPSDIELVSTITATSLLDERAEPASNRTVLTGRVLPYATLDVNSDSRRDFAVDRDGDAGNGLEEFRGNTRPGGRALAAANLTRFLTEEALASFQRDITLEDGSTARVTLVQADGDGDGKVDHLLDSDGDDQPDFYWDPDANKASRIEFRKDINGDQVPETFVDASGDGSIDVVYDLTRGAFTKVLQLDVDNDGQLDYIVDRDGDGQVDADETVLYTRTGKLLIVQKVDVDGDGRLDQVFDTDGDGNPDYFVPAGSKESVPIVLRDVNGDGTLDWTFDGDDDGRRESYYDPRTGEAHVIDATGHFLDALKTYWYIGALFALVLVLFVALVAVTRR